MIVVSTRQFQKNLCALLALARAGQEVFITKRGFPDVRLTKFDLLPPQEAKPEKADA